MRNLKVQRPVIVKMRDDAQIPTKRISDGGYDLYSVWDKSVLIHRPHTVMMFNTGIKIMFPTEYVALFRERGSTGVVNLQLRAGVVEGNFKGEYKLILANGNDLEDIIYVKKGVTPNEILVVYKEVYPYSADIESVEIEKDELGREILTTELPGGDKLTLGYIYPQSKAIAQMVIVKKEDWEFEEVSEEEFERYESVRGEGMLGSSGK